MRCGGTGINVAGLAMLFGRKSTLGEALSYSLFDDADENRTSSLHGGV
tara:strand:+ start:8834 stop:8977 length:144 start_codon:yes stop_codon:yes gene_type:complete